MKLLRNPIVTGALAVIAVVVVYLQIAPHARFSFLSASAPPAPYLPPPAPAAAPVVTTAPLPASAQPASATLAEADIAPKAAVNREFVELHFDGWVNWPQRDPFLVLTPDPPESKNKDVDANSPVGSWKLHGIYAQSGSKPYALINRGVYREGDEIQGYKLIKIEGEEVWFQGPRRKERLGFDRRMPAHP
jgi:hypothetical protein